MSTGDDGRVTQITENHHGEVEFKAQLRDLAAMGGRPAFVQKLHVGKPNLGNRERFMERMGDILDHRWLTNFGPYVQEFERRIADTVGVRHCIATCNATVALELVIRALGMTGEVIVPAFTFVATAHALQWQEITPVFADIDPVTWSLDPDEVERLINPRTTGLIGVHLWGRPCHVDRLQDLASRRNLHLIFDAAHALGCSFEGKKIGGFGEAEVFSFHATKIVNAFEGGAITTNDEELARRLVLMQNFGFTTYDQVDYIGTNGKMNEASAAMGLTSLESLPLFLDANRKNYEVYRTGLAGTPGIEILRYDESHDPNYQYVVVKVDERGAGMNRDVLQEVLWAENVIARRYFFPGCHRMEPYRTLQPEAAQHLPHTEHAAREVLCLPTGTAVETRDVLAICSIIRLAVANAPRVLQALSEQGAEIRSNMHRKVLVDQGTII